VKSGVWYGPKFNLVHVILTSLDIISFTCYGYNLVMEGDSIDVFPEIASLAPEVSITHGINSTVSNDPPARSNWLQALIITDETRRESLVFTLTWQRLLHKPYGDIRKNSHVVYFGTANGGHDVGPEENVIIYRIWSPCAPSVFALARAEGSARACVHECKVANFQFWRCLKTRLRCSACVRA
jgi:hypothetical protein